MLPKQLTIQGLYSYQEKQTIDFSKLTEAGIFGIFGAVGSGKSSILEAIGFALYGKTERLNDRENRNYNMMNLKSNELLIDFEFEHHDHTIYRFTVKGKRNSKRFQDVKTFDRSAYKLENEEWIPLESADATTILDLSYDNFRRTIIIPQGKFQEFLQLGNSDRTRMMMDIFHLHKYDLSDKVRNLESENELSIANLQGQAASYNNVDEPELCTKKEQLAEIKSKDSELKSNITKQETAFQELNKIKEKFDILKQNQIEVQELETQKESFEKRQKSLDTFQTAKLYFEANLSRRQVLEVAIKNRTNQLESSNISLQKTDQDLQQQTQYWQDIQLDYQQLDIWQKQVQEYQIGQDIVETKQKARKYQESIEKGAELITQTEKEKEKSEKTCLQLEKNIQEKKAEQPANIFVFNEMGEWFQQKNNYQKQIDNLQQQLTQQKDRIDKGKSIFPSLSFDFSTWKTQADTQKLQYKTALETLQESKNNLSLKAELHQYAQRLQDGAPCPLCGATHHPDKLEDDNITINKLNNIEEKIKAINIAIATLDTNVIKATKYTAEIHSCEEQASILGSNIETLHQTLKMHNDNFHWNDFDANNEAAFLEKRQNAEKATTVIAELEVQFSQEKKHLDNIKETLNKYQNALTERQAQYNAAQENIKTLTARLQTFSANDIEQYSIEQLSQKQAALTKQIAHTKDQYEVLQKQLQQLEKDKAILHAEIKSTELEKNKEQDELTTLNSNIDGLLQKHGFQSTKDVTDILTQKIDIPSEQAAIQQYQNRLFAAQQKIELLKAELDNKTFDETQWHQQQESLQTSKNTLTSYVTTIAQLTQTITQLQTDLEKKKQIQKQLHEKQLRKDNIQTLKNLFTGSGFVNYISSVYLKNLCIAANDRFSKLTHNQLHLELNENNEFLIRDLLNDGKTRSAKTLSGGQTFQASLSLALALADSIQYQNKSEQNFFFLDEGFGSLDKESLTTIYDTLKSLRKENRIVGIISHVEDLQQEIPVSLFVENNAEKGSQIHFQMT
ncbi:MULTISPECIES: AAA family ATPase [Chitinophagaceae]